MPENSWQINTSESAAGGSSGATDKSEEVFPSVPPPPTEVKIRTMQSDLEQMAKTGGGLPHFETVKAPQLGAVMRGEEETQKKKLDLFWIIVPILAAAILGGIVYFAYISFSGNEPSGTTSTTGISADAPASSVEPPLSTPEPVSPASPRRVEAGPNRGEPEFAHQSLFRKPADETLTFVRRSSVESAAELETFGQRLLRALSGAKAESVFLEVRFQDETGRDLAINEVLALPDAAVLAPEFLLEKFNPDPTAFVYRTGSTGSINSPQAKLTTGGDVWPGYIFALKPQENWLFLRNDVAKLESSPKIENFFLQSPGAPAAKFDDIIVVNDQPARKLTFSSGLPAQAGAVFIYGWFRGQLILSTSEEGLNEALARL